MQFVSSHRLRAVGDQKVAVAARSKNPFSVLLLNIDHFSDVNNDHGHGFGDELLTRINDLLTRTLEASDIVIRLDGQEFVVICDDPPGSRATALAERIRRAVSEVGFIGQRRHLGITCSVGIASFPEAGAKWADVFNASDEALHAAKSLGGDRIALWQPRS